MDDPISDLFASHQPEVGITKKPKSPGLSKKASVVVFILVAAAFGGGFYTGTQFSSRDSANLASTAAPTAVPSATPTGTPETEEQGLLTLDPKMNYGDKYADGMLPVGDKKYTTDAAKKGSVFLCRANFVPESQAGAQVRGPWFSDDNTTWDINKKSTVSGAVDWESNIAVKTEGKNRIITTNGLPEHKTGTFPVASTDDAYKYDRNPNTIEEQDLTYTLAANPEAGEPNCMDGEAGIMVTGASLFNAFDAGGRDAGAWEVQDACDGHPQDKGAYHYHSLSRCIQDTSVSKVIGYALDGIPITGPMVAEGSILTTSDLDECHGIVSEITLDNKKVTTYHYVMTQDFPYSVSCFRAKPVKAPGAPASRP